MVFDDGLTVPPDTLPDKPLLHAYVLILPLPAVAFAVIAVFCPAQREVGFIVGATVGSALTVMATLPDAVQLLLLVTVTV